MNIIRKFRHFSGVDVSYKDTDSSLHKKDGGSYYAMAYAMTKKLYKENSYFER